MPMVLASNIPNQFQRKSLELVRSLVPLSSSVFFLVDPDMQHRGTVLYNLKPDVEKDYTEKYGSLDPLHPERFANSQETVATLDSRMAPHFLKKTDYYRNFMVPNNHRYVADMFFRRNGNIIAVLSMMREESIGDFRSDELALLRKIQPFLEYSLNTVYLPQREQQRQSIAAKYALTDRELDVLEFLLCGNGNKQIAAEMGLGLATVKTHVHHIFQKTGVKGRSELVSAVLLDLGG